DGLGQSPRCAGGMDRRRDASCNRRRQAVCRRLVAHRRHRTHRIVRRRRRAVAVDWLSRAGPAAPQRGNVMIRRHIVASCMAAAAERLAGYLVDASEAKEPLAALTMSLPPSANTTTRVRIDASDDLVRWRMLVAGSPLLALEFGGRRLTRDRIELPPTTAKF